MIKKLVKIAPFSIVVLAVGLLSLPRSSLAEPIRRGLNVATSIDEDGINTLQAWGANLVRYQLAWPERVNAASAEEYAAWLAAALQRLDALLPIFKARGITVLLDLHTPPGGFFRETFPSKFRIFEEEWARELLTESWRMIALRYKGDSSIWAFELVSEPATGRPGGNPLWPHMAAALVKEVLAIDPTRRIVLAADYASYSRLNKFAKKIKRAINISTSSTFEQNLIFSAHLFLPYAYVKQGLGHLPTPVSYPSQKYNLEKLKATLAAFEKSLRKRPRIVNSQVLIGEFSVVRWAPGAADYLNDFLSIIESYGWNWTYQIFREDSTWSVEHGADPRDSTPSAGENDRAIVLKGYLSRN